MSTGEQEQDSSVKTGLKLHLGCGDKRLPGFFHVDARSEVNPDLVADVINLSQFANNSVDLIYFCHGLEHLSPYQVPLALNEWKRVLRSGGILRLSLPDFAALARLYVMQQIPLVYLVSAIHGGQDYPENTHYWSWDFASLTQVLTQAGFIQVQPYDAHAVNPANYADYSTFQIAGQLISLNIEATKPDAPARETDLHHTTENVSPSNHQCSDSPSSDAAIALQHPSGTGRTILSAQTTYFKSSFSWTMPALTLPDRSGQQGDSGQERN